MNTISYKTLAINSILAGFLLAVGSAALVVDESFIGKILFAFIPLIIMHKGLFMFTGSSYCNESLSIFQRCAVFFFNSLTIVVIGYK